jgi:ABC-2 type transport system permease protein
MRGLIEVRSTGFSRNVFNLTAFRLKAGLHATMLTRILKHEWRNLTADRTAWVVLILFALVIGYALYKGQTWTRTQQASLAQMRADEQKRLAQIRADIGKEEAAAQQKGEALKYPDWGARHPFYVSNYRGQQYAALPPAPLAALAVGQSDVYPNHFKVSGGLKETFMIAQDLESPFKLFAGHFDLAFVILYFFPLLILALSFNLVAAEKEDGTLAMLLANPLRLRQIVLGKVVLRAIVIFSSALLFSLLGFFLSGGRATLAQLLLWIAVVIAYGAFWFALSIAINALGKSAATNAVILAACWLAFVVVIPSVVNLLATTLYPVPSRTEFVTAMRGETQAAEMKGSQLLGKYFQDHPELAKPDKTKEANGEDDFAMLSIAKDELVGRALQPVLARFNSQLAAQHQFTNRLQFLSPAIVMQSALYDLAGTGVARYQHFLTQVESFHQTWQGYFNPRVFEKRAFSSSELNQLPNFNWQEESFATLARRALWPALLLLLVAIVIGGLGLRRYQTFPVT